METNSDKRLIGSRMKKTWIKVKRGFLQPEHRTRMGIRVWLYLYIIDQADWETGSVLEWKDKDASDELQMPLSTLRQQRQELEDLGYITCLQQGYKQKIVIMKWNDPRSYGGEEINQPTDNVQSNNEGDIQGTEKSSPLHINHISHNHIPHNNINTSPEPELEPCDIDGVPYSWKKEEPPIRKQFISNEEQRIGSLISDLLGIKPPLLQGKKDYAASTVTWWKPIREMLRQVDGDVPKAERTIEQAIDKLRGRDYVISSPQGLMKTYLSCIVNIQEVKGFRPTSKDSELYDLIRH